LLNIFDPADTISPRMAKLSFTAIGIPSKNDFDGFPSLLFASDFLAFSNAFPSKSCDCFSRPFPTNACIISCPSKSTLRLEKRTKSSLVKVSRANCNCASTAVSGIFVLAMGSPKLPLVLLKQRLQLLLRLQMVASRLLFPPRDPIVVSFAQKKKVMNKSVRQLVKNAFLRENVRHFLHLHVFFIDGYDAVLSPPALLRVLASSPLSM